MNSIKRFINGLQLDFWGEPKTEAMPAADLTRTVVLNQQSVTYRLERTRRKTVGIIIDAQGVRVRAAPRVSVKEVERILSNKADWIVKMLYREQTRAQEQHPERARFVPDLNLEEGARLTLLGRDVSLRWGNACFAPEYDAQINEVVLWAKRPRTPSAHANAQAVAEVVGAYFLNYLNLRAGHYAQQHGLRYRTLALSNARTTWGTCRRDGLIRINWRLVFLDVLLIDYVLAHELAHTVQMNHSAAFWQQVMQMCPDYQRLRKILRGYDLRHSD